MKKKLILASSEKLLDKNYLNYAISRDIYSLGQNDLKKFKIKTPHSHWKYNKKKKKDYIYLKKLYYSVLKDLVKYLNSYHSIKYNESLKGRLLTIDSLRGVAIIMVLLLHATQYCVDERKLEDLSKTPYTLLLYYVGGMSGLFFVLSSLGTSISIFKRLYNNNNNNNKSNNDDEKDYNFQTTIKNIRYSQINRSFMLIAVGYLSQLFVYRIVENNIIMHYSNGGLGRLTNEQLEWVFINPFVRNFIIEGIGFSTLITSLITIEVLSRKWTLQKIMKLYTMLVILILIFNPILRVGLDHLTCCTPTDCSYYPSNDGFNTLSSPKEIILPPNNTCSIVKNGVPITWTKQENGEEENAFNTKGE